MEEGRGGWRRHLTGFRSRGSSFRLRGGAIFSVSITRPVKPTWNKRRFKIEALPRVLGGDWGELDIFAVVAVNW